jgi:hypothetical protein
LIFFPDDINKEDTAKKEEMTKKAESYSDRVFEVDAFCNLDCGLNGGQCFMERQVDTGDIKKRCLCPAGKTGQGCSSGKTKITFSH